MHSESSPSDPNAIQISMTLNQLVLLSNALNEALEAVDKFEFHSRLGSTRQEARQVLHELGGFIVLSQTSEN